MAALHLSDANFESEVIKSNIPVLVDFWAEWCGPCRMVAPIIDEIAQEMNGKIKVGKVNVDEAQSLAMRYGIMSIPTIIIFKEGTPATQVIGAVAKKQLLDKIHQTI